ncbi:IS6 family transposase, partial [Candidatus Cardinium hertigii]
IENIRIIQKGQLIASKKQASTFENFAKLMAA